MRFMLLIFIFLAILAIMFQLVPMDNKVGIPTMFILAGVAAAVAGTKRRSRR